METNQKPKKKDGRFYLKKKIAKLQEENATLVQQLHEARDKWSDTNAKKLSLEAELLKEHAKRVNAENDLVREMERSERMAKAAAHANELIGERYVWLYEHAPFWLKWWFKYTFKGAAK